VIHTSLRRSPIGERFASGFHSWKADAETALFSFEGATLSPGVSRREQPDARTARLQILENCIEKNFHVPNMKSGLRPDSVRVQMQFRNNSN
jgi:hypothetical protein